MIKYDHVWAFFYIIFVPSKIRGPLRDKNNLRDKKKLITAVTWIKMWARTKIEILQKINQAPQKKQSEYI